MSLKSWINVLDMMKIKYISLPFTRGLDAFSYVHYFMPFYGWVHQYRFWHSFFFAHQCANSHTSESCRFSHTSVRIRGCHFSHTSVRIHPFFAHQCTNSLSTSKSLRIFVLSHTNWPINKKSVQRVKKVFTLNWTLEVFIDYTE